MVFGNTTRSYGRIRKHNVVDDKITDLLKIMLILLDKIVAILDFTHNTMFKLRSGHITLSGKKTHGIPQNRESSSILSKIISI